MHRIGRTGRAGRSGDAISFVTPRERYLLKPIEKATRQPLTQMQLPTRRGRQRHPARPLRRRDHRGAGADRRGSTASATSSPTTSASTTCPRSTSPPRWPSSLQGDEPLLLDPEAERRAPAARDDRPDRGDRSPRPRRPSRARRAPAARPHRRPDGDVPDRGRQAAQGRAAPDRRRHRQRGRPVAARTSGTSTSARDHSLVELPADLPRRGLGQAPRHPDLRQADRAAAGRRRVVRDAGPSRKPRHKG